MLIIEEAMPVILGHFIQQSPKFYYGPGSQRSEPPPNKVDKAEIYQRLIYGFWGDIPDSWYVDVVRECCPLRWRWATTAPSSVVQMFTGDSFLVCIFPMIPNTSRPQGFLECAENNIHQFHCYVSFRGYLGADKKYVASGSSYLKARTSVFAGDYFAPHVNQLPGL